MENLYGSYAVSLNGSFSGTLNVSADGGFTVFEYQSESIFSMPMRLCVQSGSATIPIGIPAPRSGAMFLRKRFTKNTLLSLGLSSVDGCILIDLSAPIPEEQTADNPETVQVEPEEPAQSDISEEPPVLDVPDEPVESVNIDPPAESVNIGKPAAAPDASAEGWYSEYEPWTMFSDEEIQNSCRALGGALRRSVGDSEQLAVPVSPSEPFPMMPVFCFGDIAELNGRQYVVFTIKGGKLV